MSIGSFFSKIGSAFEKLFGSKATWEVTALGVCKYAGPIITLVASLINPEAGSEVSNILKEIQASLSTVYAVAQGSEATAGSSAAAIVSAEISSINSNMAAILADAQVKNSAKVAQIEAESNAMTQELSNLLSALPTASPAAA